MGKKNRRRDKALRGPSAAAKTQIVYASDLTGSGSGDACTIIVQRVPTLPSLVSWCAVDVVWHDTVPKSASASTGPVTSRIA